ncbi:MAG TPA: hypothetical protein VGD74_00865 [Vulgatibacter sp.]
MRAGLLLPAFLAVLAPSIAGALPFPARLGDYSVGAGPALVAGEGGVGGGVAAEANLLLGLFSLGAHGRGVAGGGGSAAGVEVAFAGLIGVGMGVQEAGASIDGLLAVPLPFGGDPWFLSLGWRPSFLVAGGVRHEISLQIKWSSLLVAGDD